MPSEPSSEVKFEIGHVLFIDIVGYSKLLINEQSEQLQKLKAIVRGTEQFRIADGEGKLLRLPTGDGGALVFRNNPEAPVLCAMEIAKALKSYPELRVRMGIHSGPVNEVTDLNEQANIAGAGINIAQRVMDCGDAGHILLSRHVAEDLEHYPRWQPYLHELDECEVKHGVRLGLANLYDGEVGNPRLPKKLQVIKKRRTRSRSIVIATAVIIVAAVIAGFVVVSQKPASRASNVSEKSIAVLPFENLSEDKANAYFAEGIQDEILTRLANLRELKVISRTSTAKYKSRPENLRTIAAELGVANILEGTVQKLGQDVHINVQLIKAETDEHIWAQSFDRTIEHAFALEGEVAQKVADALKLTLAPAQIAKLTQLPTQNPEAYDLFLKGEYELHRAWTLGAENSTTAHQAASYYEQATQADPRFSLAYASLARAYLAEYRMAHFETGQRNQKLADLAKPGIDRALSLTPDLAQAHLALSEWYVLVEQDFGKATTEVQRAIALDPHLSEAFIALAYIWRRDNQLDKAAAQLTAALQFDPRNAFLHAHLGVTYLWWRRYQPAVESFTRAVALEPADVSDILNLVVTFEKLGNLEAAGRTLETYPANRRLDWTFIKAKLELLRLERDYQGMEEVLKSAPKNADPEPSTRFVQEGQVASGLGRADLARASFEQARTVLLPAVDANPNEPLLRAQLAYVDALLHREEAIEEGKRALKLGGSYTTVNLAQIYLAQIYALLGRADDAIQIIEQLLAAPMSSWLSVSDLKLDPDWDLIRNNPRFQKLCQDR